MAVSLKNVKPVHYYVLFVLSILIARLFENKIAILYYLFVLLGFACLYIAAKKFFTRKK